MSNKKIISNNACVVMPLLLRLAAILLIAALMVSPVISPAFGRAAARQTNRDVKIRASAGVVMNADTGEVLGQIADILTPPASNVYVVKGGAAEHMIPAVPEFIVETNVDEGFIRVRLIEGM